MIRKIEVRDRNGRVIGTKDVVTYPGLLSKAHEEGLVRISTRLLQIPTEENGRTAIAKAVVDTSKGRFEALGDASPENVNSFIAPHVIRMAETRAKARALRDAVNIGVLSAEELNGGANGFDDADVPEPTPRKAHRPATTGAEHPGGNGPAAMSDAQRRYLFRLLAGRGLEGDAAHDRLKVLFAVDSLTSVTKRDATVMIDRLLNEPHEEATTDAGAQR
jgi:hypothetical protein